MSTASLQPSAEVALPGTFGTVRRFSLTLPAAVPRLDTRVMRLEDELKDGHYVVRAEMPGVDPAKDIDVTVRNGQLTIKAERTEKQDFDGRSEFSYGCSLDCLAAGRS